jgi:hypothetical protein
MGSSTEEIIKMAAMIRITLILDSKKYGWAHPLSKIKPK